MRDSSELDEFGEESLEAGRRDDLEKPRRLIAGVPAMSRTAGKTTAKTGEWEKLREQLAKAQALERRVFDAE